mmetsp:Transcript_9253/g.15554  ORF Transcript_9253/g.15554 Transcript_9253/m.15554 type:complete len:121 (+) Transcript_9253:844-1206(+)
MEVKFASGTSQDELVQSEGSYLSDMVTKLNLGEYGFTFEERQCQGFCKVPKHLIFSIDKPSESADGEMKSCSDYIIDYLGTFASTFGVLTLAHSMICFLQLVLSLGLYFKLPSMKDGDTN